MVLCRSQPLNGKIIVSKTCDEYFVQAMQKRFQSPCLITGDSLFSSKVEAEAQQEHEKEEGELLQGVAFDEKEEDEALTAAAKEDGAALPTQRDSVDFGLLMASGSLPSPSFPAVPAKAFDALQSVAETEQPADGAPAAPVPDSIPLDASASFSHGMPHALPPSSSGAAKVSRPPSAPALPEEPPAPASKRPSVGPYPPSAPSTGAAAHHGDLPPLSPAGKRPSGSGVAPQATPRQEAPPVRISKGGAKTNRSTEDGRHLSKIDSQALKAELGKSIKAELSR